MLLLARVELTSRRLSVKNLVQQQFELGDAALSETGFIVSAHRLPDITLLTLIATL